MNDKHQIGTSFFVVLLITMVVLLALIVSLFVIVTKNDLSNDDKSQINDQMTDTPNDTDYVSVAVDNSPIFVTQTSRDSYIIGQADDVVQIDDATITSQHTILVKISSFESVAEKEADKVIYPASMTKVMTLIVACEAITDLNERLTVTEDIAKLAEDNDGSGVGLKVGESYRVEDLLYLISYQSDTIASHLIARYIAGSEEAFVDLMNNKARELGLTNTNFANCTGLYNDNNYTTCREMASIMAYAMDNEMAYRCLSSYVGRPLTVGGVDCMFYSGWYSSRFSDNPKFTGGRIIAGKTGYTDESGYTLVSCAEINGEKYINVIVTRTSKDSNVKVQEKPSADQVKYIYKTYS